MIQKKKYFNKKKTPHKKFVKKKNIANTNTSNLPIKKKRRFIGNLHIQANYKNTIIYLTTRKGKLLKQLSTQSLKKTSYKKNTPYNINFITEKINKTLKLKRILKLNVILKGTGYGNRHVMRNLSRDIRVAYMFRKRPIPFNGCRRKKKKRR